MAQADWQHSSLAICTWSNSIVYLFTFHCFVVDISKSQTNIEGDEKKGRELETAKNIYTKC